jgi:dienelactone hydrolase
MGFGVGSLQRDFEDISACIAYLKQNGKQRIVLMGHSTGAQNSIHYVLNQHYGNSAAPVDGVIVRNKFLSRPQLMFSAPSPRQ